MNKDKILDKIRDSIEDAVKPILKKGEAMTPVDLECLNKAVCIIDKIKNIEDDNSYGDGYSMHGYGYSENDGNSYRRGRSPVTGRLMTAAVSIITTATRITPVSQLLHDDITTAAPLITATAGTLATT